VSTRAATSEGYLRANLTLFSNLHRYATLAGLNSKIQHLGFHEEAVASMIPAMTYLYILLGLVVGVFSGIVGIGGGIMIIPALVYFFHMSQHKAQGTSLTALLAPIGALAFWEYYKAENVDLKAGLLIALGFLVGGYFGGLWAQHLPELVLRKVFGTLLTIIGIQLLLSRG
jgi:uncharacterized protein